MNFLQGFWVLFKCFLEIMRGIIKMFYTVKYLNILTIGFTAYVVLLLAVKLIKKVAN